MKPAFVIFTALLLASPSFAQSPPAPAADAPATNGKTSKPNKGAGAEVAGGVGTAATGVAKGAGNAAEGVGKGALDLATLHPIDAGVAVGTGAVKAGKDVTVGAVKGTGKIGKGLGRALKKIL
jgi:hypothetical protein